MWSLSCLCGVDWFQIAAGTGNLSRAVNPEPWTPSVDPLSVNSVTLPGRLAKFLEGLPSIRRPSNISVSDLPLRKPLCCPTTPTTTPRPRSLRIPFVYRLLRISSLSAHLFLFYFSPLAAGPFSNYCIVANVVSFFVEFGQRSPFFGPRTTAKIFNRPVHDVIPLFRANRR